MKLVPWPPFRSQPLTSYSEQQLNMWLNSPTPTKDAKGRIREAIRIRREGADKIQKQQNSYTKRVIAKTKSRRRSDPPKATNAVLARSGLVTGISTGGGAISVLASLDVYEQVKNSGIVMDAWTVLSFLADINFSFLEQLIIFTVCAIGIIFGAVWKLLK